MRPVLGSTLLSVSLTLLICGSALGQTDTVDRTFPWEGEVNGSNVYVRSGAGSNWYPTAKLGLGDRVLVIGKRFGWYQIVPPAGSFSYVDKSLVTPAADGKRGVIKGDNVYIRAGSGLNTRKSATQLVASKGAPLQILGEADGFYKITPPREASLYISAPFVEFVEPRARTGLLERHLAGGKAPAAKVAAGAVPGSRTPMGTTAAGTKQAAPVALAAGAQPGMETGTGTSGAGRSPLTTSEEPIVPVAVIPMPPAEATGMAARKDETAPGTGEIVSDTLPLEADSLADATDAGTAPSDAAVARPAATPGSRMAAGRHQAVLAATESDLTAELRRPIAEQSFDKLLAQYEIIAAQTDEYVPSAIAKIRIRQINDRLSLRKTRMALVTEKEDLDSYRARMRRERMQLARVKAEAVVEKFDFEGELRVSYAFAPELRRYRLIDPRLGSTLAYVDIPRQVEPHVERLIGRFVGIRTSARDYSPSARVPIAVASSIVDLTPRLVPQPAAEATPATKTDLASAPAADKPAPAKPIEPPTKASAVAAGNETDSE